MRRKVAPKTRLKYLVAMGQHIAADVQGFKDAGKQYRESLAAAAARILKGWNDEG